jgi:hypothetical protein
MNVVKVLRHKRNANALAWKPDNSEIVCTVGDDNFALLWTIENDD